MPELRFPASKLCTIAYRPSIKVRTLKRSIRCYNHFNDEGKAV